jgi:LmbE family N-acetylglucosaminyl deacetylase
MSNLKGLKKNRKKIGIYAAHDDDAVLGVGGRIVQHLKNGDDVYIVIFADGRNSHKAVLGIEKNPSVWEVKEKRKEEIKRAAKILGIPKRKLYFLELKEGEGRIRENLKEAKNQVREITKKEKPDLIYFHYPDAHPDHRAASKIVFELIKELEFPVEAYQFVIWTRELAKNRPEVDIKRIPKIPKKVIEIDIKKELKIKRRALFELRSQVNVWPYPDWQIQERPILDKKFIDYFLRGKEIFIKVQ